MNSSEVVQRYFPGKSGATLAAYATDLESFKEYLRVESVAAAVNLLCGLPEGQANLVVMHYRSELLQSGLKTNTVNRRLSTLRSLIKKACASGMIDWTLDIANESTDIGAQVQVLSTNEIGRLLKAALAQSSNKLAVRDYALFRVMYDLALKRHAIAALQFSDLDLERKTLVISLNRKQKKLPKPTFQSLRNWINQRGTEDGPLFTNYDAACKKASGLSATSVYRIVKGLGETIGLHVTPEIIRNSAIAEAVNHARRLGFSPQEVLTFSDHKNSQSLKRFSKQRQVIQASLSNLVAAMDTELKN